MTVLGVDAGCTVSSFVIFDTARQAIVDKGLDVPNAELLARIGTAVYTVFAFEKLASFGFSVGQEVFDTIEWNGRFRHAAEIRDVTVFPVKRKQCVVHHTGNAKGGDSAIRTAMLARFGKEKTEGVTYDLWQALSVAAFASDHMNLRGDVEASSSKTAEAKQDRDGSRPTGVARFPAVSHTECKAPYPQNTLSGGVESTGRRIPMLDQPQPDGRAFPKKNKQPVGGSSAPPAQFISPEVADT